MRFNNGWVKLHRSILSGDLRGDGIGMAIFTALIIMANRKPSTLKGIQILRGQLVTSLGELEALLGFTRPTLCRRLKALETYGMITRYVKRSGTMITICNYDKFQESQEDRETILQRSCNDDETIVKRERTHIGEVENQRREEEEKEEGAARALDPPALPPVVPVGDPLTLTGEVVLEEKQTSARKKAMADPEIVAIAEDWFKYAQKEQAWRAVGKSWCIPAFAEGLYKAAQSCDLNYEGLRQLLAFVKGHEFWHDKAMSPSGLLNLNKSGNRKIDSILRDMKPKRNKSLEVMRTWANEEAPIKFSPI